MAAETIIISGKKDGQKEIAKEPVRPTIIVGIGGSGGDIMLRLRKRFFEKYGSLDNIPIVSYLWLDTDTTEKDVGAGSFAQEIRFGPTEKLMTTIEDTTVITSDLNQHPHIRKWFYPGLAKLKTMTEGAGQIRAYSRLGFYQHFPAIRNALGQAKDKVLNIENERLVRDRLGLELDPQRRLQVFLIFSIAGGTGSGMFMDVSFLAKKAFPGLTPTTIGYVMLPGLFNPDEERVFANGYAALKELEHYTYENDYEAEWALGDYQPPIPGPPFTYTYLLDRMNNANSAVSFQTRNIVFNMIAENIFKDFTQGDFAAYKRGVRVNLDQYLYDKYAFRHLNENRESIIEQKFMTRYSSFGLASVTVPADRIEQACAYSLAADVVDQWGNLSGSAFKAGQLTEEVSERLLPAIRMKQGNVVVEGLTEQRADIIRTLADDGRGLGQLLYESIRAAINQAGNEAQEGVYRQKGQTLAQYMRVAAEREAVKFRNDSLNPQEWGDYARAIHFNKENYIKVLCANLYGETSRLVNQQHQSVGYAIALLRQVCVVLRDENREYIGTFDQQITQAPRRAQDSRQILESLYAETAQHERRWNLDGRKQTILNADIERFQQFATNYLRLVLNQYIYTAAKQVCEAVIAYIGQLQQTGNQVSSEGLIGQLFTLGGDLQMLKKKLLEGYEHFRKKPLDDLSLMLYDVEDIERNYLPRYLGEGERKTQTVRSVGDQILGQLGLSVLELPRRVREKGLDTVAAEIRDYARQPFQNVKRDFDVVETLWAKFPNENDRKASVRAVFNSAMFWLNGGGGYRGYTLTPQRQKILIGIPEDGDPLKLGELKRMLTQDIQVAGGPTVSVQSVPERAEIVFYTEVGGVPINWANGIAEMRQRYLRKQGEGEELHTDANEVKFNDLVILNDHERTELEAAHKCFLLGLIFGEITPDRDAAGRIKYLWKERVGLTSTWRAISLGIEMRALAELISSKVTRDKLLTRINVKLTQVKREQDTLARFNALLSWYFEEVYPEKIVSGNDGAEHHEQSNMCRAVGKQLAEVQQFLYGQISPGSPEEADFIAVSERYRADLDAISQLMLDGRRALRLGAAARP